MYKNTGRIVKVLWIVYLFSTIDQLNDFSFNSLFADVSFRKWFIVWTVSIINIKSYASDTKFWIELLLIFQYSNIDPKKIKWRNLQVANPSRVKYIGLSRYVVVDFVGLFVSSASAWGSITWPSHAGLRMLARKRRNVRFLTWSSTIGASDDLMGKSVPGLFHRRSLDAMGHCWTIGDFGLDNI